MTKQKQIQKAKAAAEPKAAPPPQAPTAVDELQAAQQYVGELLDGKAKPPNRYVGDLLQQMRDADAELARLSPRIEQLQQTVRNALDRRTALVAISQQLGLNIYRWRDDGGGKA